MSQIGLPFDWTGIGDKDGFLTSDANAEAVRHLESWRNWPIPVSILSGPPRSGRSRLARQFIRMSGGAAIDPVEGVAEEKLFHAWNRALDSHQPLLLVSRQSPAQWTISLPDLRSRIAAAPHIHISEPDDALVVALIEHGLGQVGTPFSADLPGWLARRIERSYGGVAAALEQLNQLSLSSGRKISVPYAKEALEKHGFLPIVYDDKTEAPEPKG